MLKTHCKPSKIDFSKNTLEKLWVDERTEYRGAFAERAIQSFNFIILRYIENQAEKIVPKL